MRGVLFVLLLLTASARAEMPVQVALDFVSLAGEAPGLSLDVGVLAHVGIRVEAGYSFAERLHESDVLSGGAFVGAGVPIYLHAAQRGIFVEPSARYEHTHAKAGACLERVIPGDPNSPYQACSTAARSRSVALGVGWRLPLGRRLAFTWSLSARRTRVTERTYWDDDELVGQLRVGYAF